MRELARVSATEGVVQPANQHKHKVYTKHYARKLPPSRPLAVPPPSKREAFAPMHTSPPYSLNCAAGLLRVGLLRFTGAEAQ